MQKKLIALAVAGLVSAPVFAQSNVTVYGIADAYLGYGKADDNKFSGVNSGGIVNVTAEDSATINAFVRTTAASVAVGAGAGAVAIGAAKARNLIGWGKTEDLSTDHTTASNPASVTFGLRRRPGGSLCSNMRTAAINSAAVSFPARDRFARVASGNPQLAFS